MAKLQEHPAFAFGALISVAGLVGGCGGGVRLIELPPEPLVYEDTLPVERPQRRETNQVTHLILASLSDELGHGLSLRNLTGSQHEALNLTRFDEVVNSAWFEHRVTRGMTPDEVARGPNRTGPDTNDPLTVIAGKAEGVSPGFTVRDSRGATFIVKFDPKGNLHLASAAGVISNRLLYAAGYWVPEDYILVFDPALLELSPDAEIEQFGEQRPMTEADIESVLALTDPLPDGRYHALASKFVPGQPLDAFRFSDVRKDDPNDYYHHQYRRELRGLYVISSWLNHIDMRYENTLDVFIDPPGYVRHYLIDFAATLGSGTTRPHKPREGSEHNFDLWPTLARVFTLGFYQAGWQDASFEQYHPAIGWLPEEDFDPSSWRPNWPNAAFRSVTPADGYWAAKIVASFDDARIRAAVDEGVLPEGDVSMLASTALGQTPAEILATILEIRRDKIIDYWYASVVPIEQVEARLDQTRLEILFDDLGLEAGLWEADSVRYAWEFDDGYLGLERAGESAARDETRQLISIPFGKVDAPDARVETSTATAELRIHVIRDDRRLARPAIITLRWEGDGYSVTSLKH